VGGYGRRHLSPGSDVDLLLVHDGTEPGGAVAAFEALLYPLWDAHLRVGHALRTVRECRLAAIERVDSLTAVLTARRLAGSTSLEGAVRAVATDLIESDRRAFVEGLAEWRLERGLRSGRVAEALEPDLKEALGGMRDLQLMQWLAAATVERAATGGGFGAVRSAGLVDGVEARWAREGWRFVLLVREALQRRAGDAGNRLWSAHHDGVAAALGYRDLRSERGPVWPRADALFRDVAVAGRRAELATTAALERARSDEPLPRAPGAMASARPSPIVAARRALEAGRQPLRSHLGSRYSRPRSVWGSEEREALFELLAAGDRGTEWLSLLDATDVLPTLLPQWRGVRGRPQRDPFHRFPVDVHLLRTAAELATLLHRPDEPFAQRAASAVDDVAVLLLGGLLHDVGKIGRRSHVALGVRIAGEVLKRLGVTGSGEADVGFLVQHHLLLSDAATRRDLQDEDLVVRVAASIGDPRRLAMLYLLTMADARATGPHAVTPWRLGLVRELVAKVEGAFSSGLMDADRAASLRAGERAVRRALAELGGDTTERFLADVPPGYLTAVDPSHASDHAALVAPPPVAGEVRMTRRAGRVEGTYVVSVGAIDRLGLLAELAGAFTVARFTILSAQAFTTRAGVALDVFEVRTASGESANAGRWRRLERELAEAGNAHALDRIAHAIERLRREHSAPRLGSPIEVRVDAEASGFSTVIEVAAPDRLGLLFDLTRTFAGHGVDVHSARVATYGPRVIDVFYVTTGDGEPVEDPTALDALRGALVEAAAD
jgi:[protein-PII] uridylyltransferase